MLYYQKSGCLLALSLILVLTSRLSAIAHNIQVAGDVAGLWHVEPNHNPRAGEETQAWVALTRKGGEILPFNAVNCQMGVYSQPRQPKDQPIYQPAVTAINAEKYRGIPGAKMTFPRPGLYQLQLNCQPQQAGDFQAFQLTHDVTVLAGDLSNKPVQATPSPTTTLANNSTTSGYSVGISNFILLVIPVILAIVGLGFWLGRQRS